MTFEEVSEKVGFQWAVILCEKTLKADFWGSLSFQKLEAICSAYSDGSKFKKLAIEKMRKSAQTFDEWKTICEVTLSELTIIDSKTRGFALKKMSKLAQSFFEWDAIRQLYSRDCKSKGVALKKMSELAKTFDEWHRVYYMAHEKENGLKELALKKTIALAQTVDQWRSLHKTSALKGKSRTLIIKKVIDLAECINDLKDFWESHPFRKNEVELKRLFLKKASKVTLTFHEWCQVYILAKKVPDLEELALKKMSQFNLSFDEWKALNEGWRRDGGKVRELIREKMAKLAQTIDQWQVVYHSSSKFEKLALRKMQKLIV